MDHSFYRGALPRHSDAVASSLRHVSIDVLMKPTALAIVLVLTGPVPVHPMAASPPPAETSGPTEPTDRPDATDPEAAVGTTIEIHRGVPGVVYLGQTLNEIKDRFPSIRVTPFAGQSDAFVAQIADAGVSCYVVGASPDEMRVASVGFNFDRVYEGFAEGGFRTREGIGKGSTVEDLVLTYGRAEILDERTTNPLLRRGPSEVDPNAMRKFLYRNEGGTISTYFMVQRGQVLRVVINEIAPIDRYILRRSPAN